MPVRPEGLAKGAAAPRGGWSAALATSSFHLGRVVEAVMSLLVAVAVLAVFLQVVFRYVVNQPLHWTEELARYLTIWVTLLGAALGFRSRTHFQLMVLVERLPWMARLWVGRAVDAVVVCFLLVFLIATLPLLPVASDQQSPGMDLSLIWVYASLPVGTALMVYFILARALGAQHRPLPSEELETDEGLAGMREDGV